MTVFVDSSAMIALITGEEDADDLADRLDAEKLRLCSALSVWETVAGLCRSYTFTVESARSTVRSFLSPHGFQLVDIGEREFEIAVDAYAQFGKGRHKAARSTWATATPTPAPGRTTQSCCSRGTTSARPTSRRRGSARAALA